MTSSYSIKLKVCISLSLSCKSLNIFQNEAVKLDQWVDDFSFSTGDHQIISLTTYVVPFRHLLATSFPKTS